MEPIEGADEPPCWDLRVDNVGIYDRGDEEHLADGKRRSAVAYSTMDGSKPSFVRAEAVHV